MRHVDALSRYAITLISKDSVIPKILKKQEEDEACKAILDILKEKNYEDYCTHDGLLYKFMDGRELLVIPKVMETEIIQIAHQKGHFATRRIEEIINQNYFIPNLRQKIERYIGNCVLCIVANRKQRK